MNAAWIAVACAEHVARGRAGGFMQVCHGKAAPLRRIHPGDGVVYYSPTAAFHSRVPLRAFTAAGIAGEGAPYRADMGGGFLPWRRDVLWYATQDARIAPLLPRLEFSAGRKNWGQPLRFGLVAFAPADFALVLAAMQFGGRVPDRLAFSGLTRPGDASFLPVQ